MLQNLHVLLTFDKVYNPLHLPRETTSERPQVVRTPSVLNILTSKCASRHNGVHFFDISTSKSGPSMWCFVHFDFEMCFAPQRRALFRHLNFQKWSKPGVFLYMLTSKRASRYNGVHFFDISTSKSGPSMWCFVRFNLEMCFAPQRRSLFRHLNFQKWSEHVVFCTFWLQNVLRATTACIFSSLIWPDGSAPAALASLLFDPPEKYSVFATFLPFRTPASSFFWLFLFSDLLSSALLSSTLLFSLTLPISAFHLSILSEVWLLNFLQLPVVPHKAAAEVSKIGNL